MLILFSENKTALHKRGNTGVLKNLWEFPNAEGALTEKEAEIWCAEKGMKLLRTERLPSYQHCFTHVEWSLAAMASGFWGSRRNSSGWIWRAWSKGRCPRHSGLAVRKPGNAFSNGWLKKFTRKRKPGWQLNQFIRL